MMILIRSGNWNADTIMDGNVYSVDCFIHSGGRYVRSLMVLSKADQTYAG